MPATGEAQHASKPPEHPPPNPPPTHPFVLLCGAVNAAIRLALSLCTPPTAVPLRRKGKPRPAPRINIHASAEVSAAAQEVLVLRQIKFRNEFRVARRRRDALSGSAYAVYTQCAYTLHMHCICSLCTMDGRIVHPPRGRHSVWRALCL